MKLFCADVVKGRHAPTTPAVARLWSATVDAATTSLHCVDLIARTAHVFVVEAHPVCLSLSCAKLLAG